MPWKMVFYLVIVALVLVFVGLNLDNTADISLGFISFEDVPVFMGLFVAFFLGVVVTIPVAVQSSSRKTKKRSERKIEREKRKREKEKERRPLIGKVLGRGSQKKEHAENAGERSNET